MISITRRFLLAVTLACSSVLMASASYADKIKLLQYIHFQWNSNGSAEYTKL